jgi:hypothetical protein
MRAPTLPGPIMQHHGVFLNKIEVTIGAIADGLQKLLAALEELHP